MQTSREVVDNLLRGRPAERMGVNDAIWGDTLRGWVEQEGYPTRPEKPDAPADDPPRPIPPAEHFDFDMASVGGWFDCLPLRGFKEIVDESDEWEVRRNGAGAALKYWKRKSGTPEHVDFRMTSREVWERDYRPYLLELDRERVGLDAARKAMRTQRERGKWVHYGHQFIFETMRCSLGDVCMYESLLLDPEWIHDYNRVYTDFYKMHYKLLFDEVGVPDGIWVYEDLGYKNGLMCSPKTLSELIFPYFTELVDFFHDYDLPVVLHTCGGVAEALPLILDAGFDALNPMEVNAGCDVVRFAEKHGDRLAFVGGFDKTILETGDRDLIRHKVVELLDGLKSVGARYVFGSDHSISTNVQYADFRYMIDVYRDHMMY